MEHNPILIVGTGALACLFAARLSAANTPVIMFGSWQDAIRNINQTGIHLIDETTDTVYPVRAFSEWQELPVCQYALVLVKSWQTAAAANILQKCLPGNGLALTLQNGLGNQEMLVKRLGSERVAAGVTTWGAHLQGAGIVKLAGKGSISLGQHPRLPPLLNLINAENWKINTVRDLHPLQWGKLLINSAINPLTAVLRVSNGELLKLPTARMLMQRLAYEVYAVAEAQNIRIPYQDPIAEVEEVALETKDNISSMLQDINRGAPTEIDAINGVVMQTGLKSGIPTPVNTTFWNLVKALTRTTE
jgi:2-dehydropantoate 2-reductase